MYTTGVKFGIAWMLFRALLLVCCVTLGNSFLLTILVTPSSFFQFDTFCFRIPAYLLSVQNTAQSSAVLGFSYCSINISEEKERSASLWLLLSAVPLHSRGYCIQVDMKFGNRRKKDFSKNHPPAPSTWCGSCCWEASCV